MALYTKENATINGAEAGCQAEIGSASSMVVATMATIMGGSVSVVCNVAEIAMEYHLWLTCKCYMKRVLKA